MSKWTDEQAREAFLALPMAYNADDSITSDTVIAGRRILDLEAELAEQTALNDRLADILKRTANALKGEPDPLSSHSWHDLPERAVEQQHQRDEARAELAAMRPVVEAAEDWSEHDNFINANALRARVGAYRAQREGK